MKPHYKMIRFVRRYVTAKPGKLVPYATRLGVYVLFSTYGYFLVRQK